MIRVLIYILHSLDAGNGGGHPVTRRRNPYSATVSGVTPPKKLPPSLPRHQDPQHALHGD
jgi:hypothetical protein